MRTLLLALSLLGGCAAPLSGPIAPVVDGPDGPGSKADTVLYEVDATTGSVCAAIDPMLQAGQGLGASIAVLKNGQLWWSGGCGNIGGDPTDDVSNVSAEGWRAGALTVWPVSSVSKMVMSISVLQALEEVAASSLRDDQTLLERVNELLDTDVNDLLLREGGALSIRHNVSETPITLRMLLTHTSGVVDNYPSVAAYNAGSGLTPHSVPVSRPNYDDNAPLELRTVYERHFDSTRTGYAGGFAAYGPGAGYTYSSTASAISALVVRAQLDRSFSEYSESRIFNALGMVDTAWRLADLRSASRTDRGLYRLDEERVLGLPVVNEGGTWKRPGDCLNGRCAFWEHTFYPAASLRSSVTDFSKFVGALMSRGQFGDYEQLVSPEVLVEAFDGEQTRRYDIQTGNPGYQGLIFYWSNIGGSWYVCHSGRNTGYTSNVCFLPAEYKTAAGELTAPEGDRWGVIVLSNADGAQSFITPATTWLLGQTAEGGIFANL